jgi:hypothetical protein
MSYGISICTQAPFAEAVARVGEALKAQGFGVLTEIDMRATLRDKLGQDMEYYLILGAATRPWPTRHSASTLRSACCCPATWWCAPTQARPSSRRSTRRPW